MSKFEPKIITDSEPRVYHADELNWCLRNVKENLARFKAELAERFAAMPYPRDYWVVIENMLPDDPPKATGDDAADAARFRWIFRARNAVVSEDRGQWAVILAHEPYRDVTYFPSIGKAIDAAMAREREASK